MGRLKIIVAYGALVGTASGAIAAETTTYTYDAKGRLVRIVRSGSPNNGVTADISHDKANNRARVRVSGAAR